MLVWQKKIDQIVMFWGVVRQSSRRWTVKIVISAFRRMFGEAVMAAKWENVAQEIVLKADTCNRITATWGWGKKETWHRRARRSRSGSAGPNQAVLMKVMQDCVLLGAAQPSNF